jgi:DNA-binding transcriptional LysR family regulator
MITRKYLYLVALAKEKHFGRAASACNVSPSTLSAAIRDLEVELGAALVERGQNFTALTPEGRCVLAYATRMVATATELKQELAQQRNSLAGHLRLGVIPTAHSDVALLDAAFTRRHPLVTIRLLSLPTAEIIGRLRNFELDGGVVYDMSSQADDLLFTALWKEDHVFIIMHDDVTDGRKSIRWQEAAQLPLCLLTPDMSSRKIIDEQFARLNCTPAVHMETNSIISLLAHVGTGQWASILPRSVLEIIGTSVRVLDLVDPALVCAAGLVTLARDPLPPMIAALLAEASQQDFPLGNSEQVFATS